VVFTTATPILRAEIMARSLLETEVDLAIGAWRIAETLSPSAPLTATIAPGPGRAWRGLRAYRGWIMATDGVSPAVAEGGEDWRQLGVFVAVVRRPDGTP
jgi:hypothetical protein